MRLNEQDFADLQAHINLTALTLAEHGLTLHASSNMHAFVDYIASQEKTHGVPTSHDPDLTRLDPSNSFWIFVKHEDTGDVIACHAQRLIVTDHFVEDCLAQTLFEDKAPNLNKQMIRLHHGAEEFLLSGKVVYGGGNYIRPDWRGRGLLIFNRASRSLALSQFKADYLCAFQQDTERRRKMALEGLRFAHAQPFITDGIPHKWSAGSVQLSWSSRAEWLSTVRAELQDAAKRTPTPLHSDVGRLVAQAIANSRGQIR